MVEILARGWNRSKADILLEAVRRAKREMMEELKIFYELRGMTDQADTVEEILQSEESDQDRITSDRARAFIRDLALNKVQNVLDVQLLADSLNVPSQRLAEIIKQNGERKNAKNKA